MNSVMFRKSAMASALLAIAFYTPAVAQETAGNQQLVNLVMQVQQLQDEIRSLRGQLEEQAFELESLKRRQRDQYLDLDQRISELADGRPVRSSPGLPAVSQPATGSPAVSTQSASAPPPDVPDVTERAATPSATVGLADPSVATASVQATPEMEQADYDKAFQALKDLRYADAAEDFQEFLIKYPDSELAGNAQYWLGESYYVTRNYEIALEAFEDLANKYPASNKSGDGLLKIGYTHYELKQWDEARAALEQVQQRYPNSTLSRLAESRLRSMRLEGHL